MHRLLRASALQQSHLLRTAAASPAAAALPAHAHAAAAASAASQARRCMSAGAKRNKKEGGIKESRRGGIHLADADHTDRGGKQRFKSATARDREEQEEARRGMAGQSEAFTEEQKARAQSEYEKYGKHDPRGTPEERRIVEATKADFARHMMEREPLRPGEQSWRERQLGRAGIPQQADFKAVETEAILAREARGDPSIRSSANPRNPVLVRTRAHLNPADLPPSFDHMHVPPLSANEIDAKEKALHATYWSKYSAWKAARPEEYAKWVARLEKRQQEQDYHFVQAQIRARARKDKKGEKQAEAAIERLHKEAVEEMLPSTEARAEFEAAVQADPALQAAVSTLGEEEVLRRWSAYQVFLSAELGSQNRLARFEHHRTSKIAREVALSAEDPVFTLNDPTLKLTLHQRKKIYNTLLGAKRRTESVPFWTDPDPRMEGEFDWKMADAFLKPPLLPPRSHMRAYATRTDVESNFSSLHRFLHLERLRQTIGFLRSYKKKVARERVRATRDLDAHFQSLLDSKPTQWAHIQQTYPFLADGLLSGMQSLYLAPWAQKDQQDFLTSLHRHVMLIGKLLDSHFARRNRNASWILSYPRNPRDNPDEILKSMTPREVRSMEAQMLGDQLMQALGERPEMADELEAALEAGEQQEAAENQQQ